MEYKSPVQFFILANNTYEKDLITKSLPAKMTSLTSDLYFVNSKSSNPASSLSQNIIIQEIYNIRNTTFFQTVKIEPNQIVLVEILRKAFRRQNFCQVPIRGATVVRYINQN